MALIKLMIGIETFPGKFLQWVPALFNPSEISITKTVNWETAKKGESDTGDLQWTHGTPATLSLKLFFDTSEQRIPVTLFTSQVVQLTQFDSDLHRPPLCKLIWGAFNISGLLSCAWAVTKVGQNYTLFLENGTPVRATLDCDFSQWRGDEAERKFLARQSADLIKQRVVESRETLSAIAFEEYGDPGLWRKIAEANGLDNPRRLTPGDSLKIPPLR